MTIIQRTLITFFALFSGALAAEYKHSNQSIAAIENTELKGLAIIEALDERDLGFIHQKVNMTMTLQNRHGEKSVRSMQSRTLEVTGDGDKSLIIFNKPRDIKGTAMLTFSHILKPDDQWLYLPALKRVKRISSKNKSGPFMGSEFAFEDLASPEVARYRYLYLGEAKVNGEDCYKIESRPNYAHSGYTRLINYVDKSHFRMQRIEYFDRKNSHLKTLNYLDYKQYKDKYWRAALMDMVNHQTDKSTMLAFSEYDFKSELSEQDFNKNALKRAR